MAWLSSKSESEAVSESEYWTRDMVGRVHGEEWGALWLGLKVEIIYGALLMSSLLAWNGLVRSPPCGALI